MLWFLLILIPFRRQMNTHTAFPPPFFFWTFHCRWSVQRLSVNRAKRLIMRHRSENHWGDCRIIETANTILLFFSFCLVPLSSSFQLAYFWKILTDTMCLIKNVTGLVGPVVVFQKFSGSTSTSTSHWFSYWIQIFWYSYSERIHSSLNFVSIHCTRLCRWKAMNLNDRPNVFLPEVERHWEKVIFQFWARCRTSFPPRHVYFCRAASNIVGRVFPISVSTAPRYVSSFSSNSNS